MAAATPHERITDALNRLERVAEKLEEYFGVHACVECSAYGVTAVSGGGGT
jgi:hypothetical protein